MCPTDDDLATWQERLSSARAEAVARRRNLRVSEAALVRVEALAPPVRSQRALIALALLAGVVIAGLVALAEVGRAPDLGASPWGHHAETLPGEKVT